MSLIPYDKKWHAIGGFALALVVGMCLWAFVGHGQAILAGIFAAALAGVLKEWRDSFNPKHHSVEFADALATLGGGLLAALALLGVLLLMGGCKHGKGGEAPDKWSASHHPTATEPAGAERAAAPTIGKVGTVDPPAKTAQEAIDRESDAIAQVHFWQAKAEVAHEEAIRIRDQERRAWIESLCRWAIAACVVGLIGNVALFAASYIWPWFERLRYVAAGGAAAAIALIYVLWKLPAALEYPLPVGLAIVAAILGGIGALVWHLHRNGRLHHAEALARRMLP